MNGATIIRWGATVPGREAKGLAVFGKAIEHFEGLAKQNRIHAHHEYIALTGKDGGFMILEGDTAELMKIAVEPETLALNAQAGAIVEDFEIQVYGGGTDQAIQELMGSYTTALQQIDCFA